MREIADVIGGGTPRTNDPTNYEGGEIPWITPADLSGYTEKYISRGARNITQQGLASSSARLLPAGTVLFSSRAPIGYVAIAEQPVATNQGFKSFVLADGIDPSYVYHYLHRAREIARGMASGTTFLELSGAKAAELPIPIPPLPEQRRIVAEIETQFTRLDAAVAALKRTRVNLKRYRAAVLASACNGHLLSLNTSSNWPKVALESLIPQDRRASYGVLQPGNHVDDGVPLVRVGDISDGKVNIVDMKRIRPEIAAQYVRTTLQGGELLLTVVGSIGRAAIAPSTLAGANTARAVAVVPLVEDVNPEWISIWFRNPSKMQELTSTAHEVARKTLNMEDVRRTSVALPSRAEQDQIVEAVQERLSIVEAIEGSINDNLKRAEHLRQSILRTAFAGELVPHDPDDEPASFLLERIRQE